jgi:hypothetical protein
MSGKCWILDFAVRKHHKSSLPVQDFLVLEPDNPIQFGIWIGQGRGIAKRIWS